MQLEMLSEFVVYTQFLSIAKAAERLHMSQPNLSKHLKQLEAETGLKLFIRDGQRTRLTRTGEHFLVLSNDILDRYNTMLEECRNLDEKNVTTINAMQHYYSDEGSKAYYSILFKYKHQNPNVVIHFANPYREDNLHRLRNGDVDIIISYAACPLEYPDLYTRLLSKVRLGVFCMADSPLASKDVLTMSDLMGTYVFKPNDANVPFYNALDSLFEKEGFNLRYRVVGSSNQTEFCSLKGANTCYIFPYGMKEDQRICVQFDRVVVPLDAYLDEYMIWRKEDIGDITAHSLLTFDK